MASSLQRLSRSPMRSRSPTTSALGHAASNWLTNSNNKNPMPAPAVVPQPHTRHASLAAGPGHAAAPVSDAAATSSQSQHMGHQLSALHKTVLLRHRASSFSYIDNLNGAGSGFDGTPQLSRDKAAPATASIPSLSQLRNSPVYVSYPRVLTSSNETTDSNMTSPLTTARPSASTLDLSLSACCEALLTSPNRAEEYKLKRRLLYASVASTGSSTALPTSASSTNDEVLTAHGNRLFFAAPAPRSRSRKYGVAHSTSNAADEEGDADNSGIQLDLTTKHNQPSFADNNNNNLNNNNNNNNNELKVVYRRKSSDPIITTSTDETATAAGPPARKHSLRQRLALLQHTPQSPVITPKIGHGGFGSVFIGHYDGKCVAIKQLHNRRTANNDKNKGNSLKAELNMFRLSHSNIVRILAFSTFKHLTQIVYEYAGARNLQGVLDDPNEPLPFGRIHSILWQVSEALSYCHRQRLVHLDLKPANVLLADYEPVHVKLCDFGSSKRLPPKADTIKAETSGTLIYKSPELLRGNVVSVACDTYAFGLLVWQMLSRRSPFSEYEHAHTIVFLVVTRALRPATDQLLSSPTIPSHQRTLLALAQACWAQEPAQRPTDGQLQARLLDVDTAETITLHL